MTKAREGRRCPVCDTPLPPGSFCPHCRTRPAQNRSHKASWMLAAGALFVLAALIFWVRQLGGEDEHAPREFSGTAGAQPVPDATPHPGEPLAVPFGEEKCVPWHVSEAEAPPEKEKYLVLTSRIVDPNGLVLSGFGTECGERHPAWWRWARLPVCGPRRKPASCRSCTLTYPIPGQRASTAPAGWG
jgi:hypothetical protein